MKGLAAGLIVALTLLCTSHVSAVDNPMVLNVWPGKVPMDSGVGYYGPIGPEHVRDPNNSPTKDAKWITSVTKPTISVFRPAKEKNTGVAIVICPGGGYWNLAWDLEGEEVAAWFNKAGITGIVLKYRVPRRDKQPEPLPAPGPLLDAQRAMSLVRSRAKAWGIDPSRIGMAGFSAGGHLTLATAINFDKRAYELVDDVDKVSCRPDFAVAVYPGYLWNKETGVLESYMRIPRDTPPVMLVHASDDTVAGPEHSVVMYQALKKAGVPVELHIYASSGHGFGVRKEKGIASSWAERCVEWLRGLGLLNQGPK